MKTMIKCEECKASKHIKESLGCNCDRIHNNLEVIKGEFLKTFKIDYQPKFQCRFADLVEGDVMKVKFKNSSELKVISSDISTRPEEIITYYRKYPVEFVKDLIPDVWDNLYWYQKAYISSLIKSQNLKEQFVMLIPKQRVCINCVKKFKDRQYYYKPCRGSSKTITDMARFIKTMCCSDECFNEYWNEFWRERWSL